MARNLNLVRGSLCTDPRESEERERGIQKAEKRAWKSGGSGERLALQSITRRTDTGSNSTRAAETTADVLCYGPDSRFPASRLLSVSLTPLDSRPENPGSLIRMTCTGFRQTLSHSQAGGHHDHLLIRETREGDWNEGQVLLYMALCLCPVRRVRRVSSERRSNFPFRLRVECSVPSKRQMLSPAPHFRVSIRRVLCFPHLTRSLDFNDTSFYFPPS